MPFKKFLRRKEPLQENVDIEDYLNEMSIREGKIIEREDITYVKPIDLEEEGNLDDVIKELGKGNMVVLNVKQLIPNKMLLRDVVKKLRDVCIEIDGDIGRISHEKILLVPSNMRIAHRNPP